MLNRLVSASCGIVVVSLVGGCMYSRLGAGASFGEGGVRPTVGFEGGGGYAGPRLAIGVGGGVEITNAAVEDGETAYSLAGAMVATPVAGTERPFWGVARANLGWGMSEDLSWTLERGAIGVAFAGHGRARSFGNRLGGNFGAVELSIVVTREHGAVPATADNETCWSVGVALQAAGIGQLGDVLIALVEDAKN